MVWGPHGPFGRPRFTGPYLYIEPQVVARYVKKHLLQSTEKCHIELRREVLPWLALDLVDLRDCADVLEKQLSSKS